MSALSDVLVVVKGGTTDLGLALARVVGLAGARPVIVDADAGAVAAAVEELRFEGIDARGALPDSTGPLGEGQVLVFAMEAPKVRQPLVERQGRGLRLVAVNE